MLEDVATSAGEVVTSTVDLQPVLDQLVLMQADQQQQMALLYMTFALVIGILLVWMMMRNWRL